MVWIPAQLPDRLCDDAGNRTTIDSVSKVADGVVVFWVPHFSTYEIVKVSAAADTAPATTAPATTTVDAAAVDAQFYTCKAAVTTTGLALWAATSATTAATSRRRI